MNEQLQAQIAQILSQIVSSVEEVKDYSVNQLPSIAQEYINYGTWSNAFYCVVCLGVLIYSIKLFKQIKKFTQQEYMDEYTPLLIFPVAIGFLSFVFFIDNLSDLVLVLTAPKVWLIISLKHLLWSSAGT